MKKYTLETHDITLVEFNLENMETVEFTKEEFEHFYVDTKGNLECSIVGCGSYHIYDNVGYYNNHSPLDRLAKYDDIVSVTVWMGNDYMEINMLWEGYENNINQTTTRKAWNKMEITVKQHIKLYSLHEVLEDYHSNQVFTDERGLLHKVIDDKLFLLKEDLTIDTPVIISKHNLNLKFKKYEENNK